MIPTREEVICTWPSCGHTARGECNSHQLTGLRPGNHTVDLLVAENASLRERLEAAEAERDATRSNLELVQAALTEARAREAAAWEAGRDALRKAIIARFEISPITVGGTTVYGHRPILAHPLLHEIDRLTPPTDATAALTAVKDAAWNAAIEAAGNLESIHGYSNAVPRHRIRALRRNPKEGV